MRWPTEKETVEYFSNLLSENRLDKTISQYCIANDIDKSRLLGKTRKPKYVHARQEIAKRSISQFTEREIAEALNKERSTINHYINDYVPHT
jgi:hypothetical protein